MNRALMFVLTVALLAIVTPENRFAMIPLAILSPLSAHLALTFGGKPRWFLAVAIAATIFGWTYSVALNDFQTSEVFTRFNCPR